MSEASRRRWRIGRGFAISGLLGLVLIMGGFNLLATYQAVHNAQAAQRRTGEAVEAKICATLDALAALKPPPGDPGTNPSRVYLQKQHDTLGELSADLGCP